MAFPLCQPVTRQQYNQLCTHASQQPDFVFLGSQASSGGRGGARGFSCLAVEQVVIESNPGSRIDTPALAAKLEALADSYRQPGITNAEVPCPLAGGWVGSIAYEFGYAREPRLNRLAKEHRYPLFFSGLYLWMASEDLESGECYLWVHPALPAAAAKQIISWLESSPNADHAPWLMTSHFTPTQSPERFRQRVDQVRHYIQSGDCYQANLSQSFEGRYQGSPWAAFNALSHANPTPYAAFLRFRGNAVVSVSPERFLAIRDGVIETSPIKGTRARGQNPEQDEALAQELLTSEKDRAENLMIVDLLRNDLSVHALPGSVSVDELFALESYRNVHHLVSHIRAKLKPGISPLQALFDAFPGGSITGAPKIRAMEIIAELEPHWRGPYCGSVFYYALDGNLDSSIAIRTLLCEPDGTVSCWGGGGIVADSEPEAEYQETLAKVQPLMRFLEQLKL
ncbi:MULTISPECIES: aminodeoxychorismate synthase component I [unclassified Marinobacter]|uniref:aminodeoxychorismate synthase component I n=1 Tax=unclassified Marinobacter TaxID=83889 RepID=UPI001268AE2B|nr:MULTISPECIES: aminodeoxychorismate synthase component I [unclassified Marinobacter]QFS86984.1 Aminodeoxychorismate synthase component 1 [Marinobacter sp. THAF197a]QFT50768.1 Aminodeoxychorismate synthase component 1 [Marinobacter sp. THAF39]